MGDEISTISMIDHLLVCRNLAPVTSWILEWGPHAKVIEPPELVAQVKREMREALQRYET